MRIIDTFKIKNKGTVILFAEDEVKLPIGSIIKQGENSWTIMEMDSFNKGCFTGGCSGKHYGYLIHELEFIPKTGDCIIL